MSKQAKSLGERMAEAVARRERKTRERHVYVRESRGSQGRNVRIASKALAAARAEAHRIVLAADREHEAAMLKAASLVSHAELRLIQAEVQAAKI